jgi:hypothetical protein
VTTIHYTPFNSIKGLIVQALGEELQYTQTSLDAAHAFVVLIRAAASDEDMTVRR